MDHLQLEVFAVDDIDVVGLGGELDAAAAPRLRTSVLEILDRECRRIIVDLREVTLLDCAAIGSLLQMQGLARQRGADLHAVGATGSVLELLEVTGVAKRLNAYERLDDIVTITHPDPRTAGIPEQATRSGRMPDHAVDAALLAMHDEPVGSPKRSALRQRAIELALPLAEQLARRYANRGQGTDDLTQVAYLGLVKAVDGYNPHLGHRFISYAIPTILGELRRYFRDKTWGVRVPRRLQELRLELAKATEALTQLLDRSPTITELADYLDADEEDIIEAETAARGYRPISLYHPLGDSDDGAELVDILGSNDHDLDLVDLHTSLPPLLATLPQREQRIIALRFFGNLTQSEIAQHIGISQMHVSRLLNRALTTMRTALTQDA
ncbi:MAG TPA: SigB/SigF/SigG family RNA polymerase sigma factor [Micromonosporaceae bacterium]|nr:SigB/SigF/SigG family RNA polymerase sigma factor [Micromonosporaceae bacterium]